MLYRVICRNNPIIFVDPTGHDFGISIAIGAFIGAYVGAASAQQNGGDFLQGALTGAITGAITAGAFNVAGGICAGMSSGAQVSVHAATGAITGGINASITGGDIGMGMLTGAISGGMSKWAGNNLFGQGKLFGDNLGGELLGRSLIGGVTGGMGASIAGGNFGSGFAWGAGTAVFGMLFNDQMHKGKYSYARMGRQLSVNTTAGNGNGKFISYVKGMFSRALSPFKKMHNLYKSLNFSSADTRRAIQMMDVVVQGGGAATWMCDIAAWHATQIDINLADTTTSQWWRASMVNAVGLAGGGIFGSAPTLINAAGGFVIDCGSYATVNKILSE